MTKETQDREVRAGNIWNTYSHRKCSTYTMTLLLRNSSLMHSQIVDSDFVVLTRTLKYCHVYKYICLCVLWYLSDNALDTWQWQTLVVGFNNPLQQVVTEHLKHHTHIWREVKGQYYYISVTHTVTHTRRLSWSGYVCHWLRRSWSHLSVEPPCPCWGRRDRSLSPGGEKNKEMKQTRQKRKDWCKQGKYKGMDVEDDGGWWKCDSKSPVLRLYYRR